MLHHGLLLDFLNVLKIFIYCFQNVKGLKCNIYIYTTVTDASSFLQSTSEDHGYHSSIPSRAPLHIIATAARWV
jgi:hypothetical protein